MVMGAVYREAHHPRLLPATDAKLFSTYRGLALLGLEDGSRTSLAPRIKGTMVVSPDRFFASDLGEFACSQEGVVQWEREDLKGVEDMASACST